MGHGAGSFYPVSLQSGVSAQSNNGVQRVLGLAMDVDKVPLPQLTYDSIVLNLQPTSGTADSQALPNDEHHVSIDSPRLQSESLSSSPQQPAQPPPRAWGSKYMRHLITRTTSPRGEKCAKTEMDDKEKDTAPVNPGSEENSVTSSVSVNKAPAKVDAEMAVFLEEVDLESDQDECFESEEAMARILEQEVNQVSEV